MGEIILIMGPMYSGKTTTLISKLERFKRTGKTILVIKYKDDLRYTNEKKLVSHAKNEFIANDTVYVRSLSEISDERISLYDIIGIDEGQFFSDITTVNKWANINKKIYISALNGTYNQMNFKGFEQLYPYVDNIILLNAICAVCNINDAPFTYKLISNESIEQIDIGGDEKYMAICRECLNKKKR